MKKLTSKEVQEKLSTPPLIDLKVIQALKEIKSGEGLAIGVEHWHNQTGSKCHPATYFATCPGIGSGVIKTKRIVDEYLFVKL